MRVYQRRLRGLTERVCAGVKSTRLFCTSKTNTGNSQRILLKQSRQNKTRSLGYDGRVGASPISPKQCRGNDEESKQQKILRDNLRKMKDPRKMLDYLKKYPHRFDASAIGFALKSVRNLSRHQRMDADELTHAFLSLAKSQNQSSLIDIIQDSEMVVLHNIALQSLLQMDRPQSAIRLFQDRFFSKNEHTIFNRNNDPNDKVVVIKLHPQRPLTPTIITLNTMLKACKSTKNLSLALEIFEKAQRMLFDPKYHANILEISDGMLVECTINPAMTYVSALSVCAATQNLSEAVKIFKDYVNRGLELNGPLIGAMAQCFARSNSKDALMNLKRLFELSRRNGITLSVVQYSPLISTLIQCKEFNTAKHLIEALRGFQKPPNPKITHLICDDFLSLPEWKYDTILVDQHLLLYYQILIFMNQSRIQDGIQKSDDIDKERLHILMNEVESIWHDYLSFINIANQGRRNEDNKTNHHSKQESPSMTTISLYIRCHLASQNWEWQSCVKQLESVIHWNSEKDNDCNLLINRNRLDLHLLSHEMSVFIIRYLFGYQRQFIMEHLLQKHNDDPNHYLTIVVGKQSHGISGLKHQNNNDDSNKNNDKRNTTNHGGLAQTIVEEMHSWNPPLQSARYEPRMGSVLVSIHCIRQFFSAVNPDPSLQCFCSNTIPVVLNNHH